MLLNVRCIFYVVFELHKVIIKSGKVGIKPLHRRVLVPSRNDY